ncbi:MAG TPA: retropepsin-like aspartic protease [Verrucomicrobiae bacterium]|nr:retropepsin-like aspartic protease [Verrucomicrobiae bacterium]
MSDVRVAVAVLILALSGAGAVTASPGSATTIPFEFRNGLLWVSVSAGGAGEPLEFLIDTGAASSAVDRGTARRIGWPLREAVSVRGVDTEQEANWTAAEKISVDGVAWTHKFVAVDLRKLSRACDRPVDGLLGADFLRGRVAQFDYVAHVLRLLANSPGVGGATVLRLRQERGAFCVPVRVNGSNCKWVRLDTGCAKPLHWVTKAIQGETSAPQVCIGLADVPVPFARETVQIGGDDVESVEVGLHKHEIFAGEAGLLGNGLLSRYVVTIDARAGRVVLARAGEKK